MKVNKSFWSLCEELPGLVAVKSEWQAGSGKDLPGAFGLLRPRQQRADAVPCRAKPPCGCYHEVMDCGDGALEAVCRCQFHTCETFSVTPEELVAYELDFRRLCDALSSVLGLAAVNRPLVGLHRTYQVGDYYPYEGYRFPAYLTIQHEATRLERIIYRLCSTSRTPFILLLPTRALLDEGCEHAIRDHGSVCFALTDTARIGADGSLTIADSYRSAMREFHARVVPAEKSEVAFFPTPPGSTWCALHISFPDNDHMACRIDDTVRRFNFAEVGMRDRRSNGRTKQWDLMLEIARNGGVLDRSIGDPRANKKQKQELSDKLRRVFRIEGDPFLYDETSGCWQALIHLSA